MKKTILALTFALIAMTVTAQKQDSLVLQITIDTTTFKAVVQLIQENINGQTQTGRLLLQSILGPLYNYKLVPREKPVVDKPKNK